MQIACIHQGYELYGSDRSFAECVHAIRSAYPEAKIEIVLPRNGPIVSLLDVPNAQIVFEPIWVLRRRNLLHLATIGIATLPMALFRAIRRFRKFDLVYINTSVIFDYAIAARLFPGRALLHIHEIPEGIALNILRKLVRWSRADIIFNSRATSSTFPLPSRQRSEIIYNGVKGPQDAEPISYDSLRPLRVAMLGRINRIKGQEVLIDAIARLPSNVGARLIVRIIGSAFEDSAQETALANLVQSSGLARIITLEPFTMDTASIYRWADIIVVPSRRPESLGRVAIEAMAYGRPVIASAIGGLTEVVLDGKTGWLVPPGDAACLAWALENCVHNRESWREFGIASRQRFEAIFSEETASEAIAAIFARKIQVQTKNLPLKKMAGLST